MMIQLKKITPLVFGLFLGMTLRNVETNSHDWAIITGILCFMTVLAHIHLSY